MNTDKSIQIFEHSFLPIAGKFEQRHFVALSKLNALHNDEYFDIRHNGIKFKQYVGVVQVDGLTIEILPKIDRYENESKENKQKWQKVLIEMLRVARRLKVQKVEEAHVKKQNIHLLDIYFEWFLNEVHLLIHQGLIKQYYKETSNVKALKGKIEFAGHLSKNLVHKERFYTTHQVYDKDHLLHQILNMALNIVAQMTKGGYLYSKCKTVQLDFPEVQNITVTEKTFEKIPQNRKTAPYNTALKIARLIILNYAPNIYSGSEKMLALLFDMNSLWEEYICVRLKESYPDLQINAQKTRNFWGTVQLKPDIHLKINGQNFIIDTKWKNIENQNPSPEDLRQIYAYNDYWESRHALLLYPSKQTDAQLKTATYYPVRVHSANDLIDKEQHTCSVARLNVFDKLGNLDPNIGIQIMGWLRV